MPTKSRTALAVTIPYETFSGVKTGTYPSTCSSNVAAAACTYTPFEESITYENGRERWNDCLHTLTEWRRYTGHVRYQISNASAWASGTYCTYDTPYHYWYQGTAWQVAIDNEIVPISTIDRSEYASNALKQMWPGIENKLGESLINSIIDLPKLKRLPAQLDELRSTTLKALKTLLTKHGPKAKRWALRSVVRNVANTNLLYRYGIKTLVDDAIGVCQSARRVRNELENLIAYANRDLVAHYAINLPNPTDPEKIVSSTDWTTGTTFNGKRVIRFHTDVYVAKFYASLKYRYSVPSWNRDLMILAAYLDAVGVNLNPRIIWDAIPFSFVVDWVIKVGDFLDQFKRRNIEPVVEVRDFLTTIHIDRRDTLSVSKEDSTTMGFKRVDIGTKHVEYYSRERSVPNLYGDIQSSGLSTYECVMGGSLLAGRTRW